MGNEVRLSEIAKCQECGELVRIRKIGGKFDGVVEFYGGGEHTCKRFFEHMKGRDVCEVTMYDSVQR